MLTKDWMNHNVIQFQRKDTVEHALAVMNQKAINGAPVVNEQGELIGMVVKSDIYRFLITPGRNRLYPLELVMSKEVITATPDEELKVVAKRILENNIIGMPIVEGKQVVGFISLEDIVNAYLQQ